MIDKCTHRHTKNTIIRDKGEVTKRVHTHTKFMTMDEHFFCKKKTFFSRFQFIFQFDDDETKTNKTRSMNNRKHPHADRHTKDPEREEGPGV